MYKNKDLLAHIGAAMLGVTASGNFSALDINRAAVNEIKEEFFGNEEINYKSIRKHENEIFDLIETKVDEILPAKLQDVFGRFAEIKNFPRNAKIEFYIEKLGRSRAKLVISKGAREGTYRAARLDNKTFAVESRHYTAGVYISCEELLAGTRTLSEMYNDIVEGFNEEIMREVYNELTSGATLAGYNRINGGDAANVSVTKAALGDAIDKVMPYVSAYGVPTIFGSLEALSSISNPLANTVAAGYPNSQDSMDIRENGFVQVYKGHRLVVLPNYLISLKNDTWFYDPSWVFVIPGDIKPVKIGMVGETMMRRNKDTQGGETWDAEKEMGVGIAMANNFAVIKVTDITTPNNIQSFNATDYHA